MAKQKTTTLDIYAKRQTKKQEQLEAERAAVAAARTATPKTTTTKTTTTPNPALAQAVVASVGNAGNTRGLLSVGGAVARNAAKTTTPTINIRSGATSAPSLRSARDHTRVSAAWTANPSTLERIGTSALGGVKDWASSYMDYAAVGASAEHTSGKDLTSSELARWQNEAAREQKVIDSYERGEGIYDKSDYEIAKEQLATYQTYIDSYQKAAGAQETIGEQTAAESSKLRQSAALDTLWATSGLGKVGTALVRGVGTTTQNTLDLLMSGGASALPSIAARVYGQSTQEALDKGDSREKAVRVGLARAAAELIPEGLSGGNPLTDAGRGKASLLQQTLDKLSSSKYVNNFVTKLGAGALGEGTEEVITQGLNDLISGIAYGKDATLSTPEEYAEAFWGGVIGSLYGNVINPRATINNVRQDVDDIISRREAAQSAAQDDAQTGDITTGAQPAQDDGGAFNTAEAQAEAQPEQQQPTTVLDIYQNRGTKQTESTVVDTDPTTHTEAQQAVINDYQSSTDSGLVSFVQKVRSLVDPNYRNKITYSISAVSPKQAQDIKAVTGVDATGFENIITGDAVAHIDRRHGVDGEHDNSMADVNDIARIGYVMDNYDSVELQSNSDGTPRASKRWRNSDGSAAPQIVFKKKIDGTMYVVEAVPDSQRNALAVVTAYIQENNGSKGQVLNISQSEPQPTSETPVSSIAPVTDTVPQEAPVVNSQNEAASLEQLTADYIERYNKAREVEQNGGEVSPEERAWLDDTLQTLQDMVQSRETEKLTRLGEERALKGETSKGRNTPENHIDNRDFGEMGSRSVKAFSFDHPELHPYFVKVAEVLREDVGTALASDVTTKTNNGRYYYHAGKPQLVPVNGDLSRMEILEACNNIIEDNGQENYAAAKRTELILDDMLTNGYWYRGSDDTERRFVPPDSAYIEAKSRIAGGHSESEIRARQDAEVDDFMRALGYDVDGETQTSPQAEADGDGLYGRSVGAATPRRGEQVESRNNLQHDANLSEEGREAVADAGNTHERISNSLARSRAEANIARDGDGNWLNLQDCMDDLQATIEGGGVLTPEQVKLSEMVLVELDHIAREDGDRSTFNAFNRMVIQASKTAAGQSLNAWREFSNGYISTVDTATEIVEAARENPATNQNRKRTNREADEILRRVSNQVGEAADRTLMRIGLDERQADNIPKLRELITQSWQNKQRAYDDLMAYFVERYNMSEQEAGLAANNISTLFYGELAELSSEALHRKFDNKKRNQTDTTWIDKTVELINMGALTDADFRAVASEKLFGTRASDEVLSRISQYAEDAQELRDAGDVDGLRDHVVMLSTERGYKPSRGIQKILGQKTDVNDLYTLAQSLAVGIAVDQAKPSFGQKLATWQYLSHLYNTGTIMRNFAANTVFSPIDRLSNSLAIVPDFFGAMIRSASEGGTVGQNRTVARQPWGFNRNVRQTRKAYVDEARIDNALDINRGAAQGKYTGQTRRLTNRTFDQKGNWWNRLNNFREGMLGVGLNVADAVQKGTTKGQSESAMDKLRQTGGVMTEEAAQAITESDMLYRSFQRDTPLGTLLSITREWLNTIGIGRTRGRYMDTHEFGVGSLVDAYTQVPGALLHTAADYTPLGIVNTVLEIYNAIQFNRGQVDAMAEPGALSPQYKGMTNADASVVAQHNAALSVGRMATGGLIFGLFSFLAQVGAAAIRLYGDDDRDKDETLEAQGVGGFQFNQDAFIRGLMGEDATWQDGDIIHDLSQYPPVSTIAQLAVIYADDDNDDKFIRMLDATARSLAEQFGDLSMMSSAKTVYDDIQYRGDKNTWEVMGDIAGDLAGNAVTGMIPGTFRQLARTTDPYMRDTSADSVLGRAWNRFRSVTPGLRQTLPAKVDYKGEARQYTGNTLSRFLNAFVLPGNVTVYRQDDVVDYIDQLSEASGTSLYADAYAPKKLDYDGERYELDSDARRDYNEAYKSDYYDSMKTFMQSKYARAMSDDMAAEVASGLRGLAAYRAKREFFKAQGKTYAPDNDLYKRYDSIADPALYMAMREAVKALTASGGTDNKAFNAAYLKWQSLSAEERAKYTDGVEGSFDGIDTLKKLDSCLQAGMSTEQFCAAKAEYKALGDDDSLNAGTRRAEFAYWLDTQSGFDSAARAAALENFKFTTTIVSDEGGYEKMTAAGVSKAASEKLFSAIQALTPEAGYTNVSDLQKCETITGSSISEKEKLAALEVYSSEAQTKYYQAAYNNGIALSTWTAVRRDMHKHNTGSGNDVSQSRLLRAMERAGIPETKARAMFAVYYPKSNFDKAMANAE